MRDARCEMRDARHNWSISKPVRSDVATVPRLWSRDSIPAGRPGGQCRAPARARRPGGEPAELPPARHRREAKGRARRQRTPDPLEEPRSDAIPKVRSSGFAPKIPGPMLPISRRGARGSRARARAPRCAAGPRFEDRAIRAAVDQAPAPLALEPGGRRQPNVPLAARHLATPTFGSRPASSKRANFPVGHSGCSLRLLGRCRGSLVERETLRKWPHRRRVDAVDAVEHRAPSLEPRVRHRQAGPPGSAEARRDLETSRNLDAARSDPPSTSLPGALEVHCGLGVAVRSGPQVRCVALRCVAWCGAVRCCAVRCGAVRCRGSWRIVACRSLAWRGRGTVDVAGRRAVPTALGWAGLRWAGLRWAGLLR